jgi:hypothetical protein
LFTINVIGICPILVINNVLDCLVAVVPFPCQIVACGLIDFRSGANICVDGVLLVGLCNPRDFVSINLSDMVNKITNFKIEFVKRKLKLIEIEK